MFVDNEAGIDQQCITDTLEQAIDDHVFVDRVEGF